MLVSVLNPYCEGGWGDIKSDGIEFEPRKDSCGKGEIGAGHADGPGDGGSDSLAGCFACICLVRHLCGENIGDSKGKEELEAKSRRHEFVELDLVPLHKKPSLFQENGQLNGTER